MTQEPIAAVTQVLIDYHPRFAEVNYASVRRWIEEGADLQRDILPVLRYWINKKPDIYSLGFFTRYVRQSRESHKQRSPVPDHVRAANIAWHRKRNLLTLQVGIQDYEWLAKYEEKHGIVEG